jgi:acyl-CoA synthetase (AMP-forming)/AMP-acid ligase II
MNLVRRIHWLKFLASPRIGRRSKLTCVDGVNELWTSLLDEDSILVTVPPNELQSRGIVSIYSKCTQLLMLPSQLNQMLLLPKSPSLQRVLVSGEVCSSALVTKFCSVYESCELLNLYGQTESTGDVCCAILGASKEVAAIDNCVAIGAPILD